ncbi:MAG: glycosyltransferase, partial [Elusimicrobiota bacterium]
MTPELSIVLPCYNEEGNIPVLLERFRALTSRAAFELILVDNGSTDGTAAAMSAALAAAENSFARSVRVEKNIGYGHGLQTGLEAARAPTVAISHADLQCPPADVLRAYDHYKRERRRGPCLVKGRRLGRPWADRAVTWCYNRLATAALGLRAESLEGGARRVSAPDINAEPKVFERGLTTALADGGMDFTYDLFVLLACARAGVRVLEFDVRYDARGWGSSKLAANPWVRVITAWSAARRIAELSYSAWRRGRGVRKRRSPFAISWALPVLFLCGWALAADDSCRELLNRAERLFSSGKNQESMTAAQAALAEAEHDLGPEAPETGPILSRLSRIYAGAGTAAQLLDMEKRLSAVKSKGFEVWFALGTLLRAEGKSLEAEKALKKAAAFKPEDSDVVNELALVYDDMGRFEEEALFLEEKIERRPQDYYLYSRLAGAYTRLGRPADAQKTYSRARKMDGKKAAAYIDEGYFFLYSGEPVHAREAFESAIAVDSANPIGYHHMGSYLDSLRQYAEAEEYFRRALDMLEADPDASANDIFRTRVWLGEVWEAQGRHAEAEAVFRHGLEEARPGSGRQLYMLHWLAMIYVAQGKSSQAEETYKRAVAACAVRFKCRFDLAGRALIDLGEFHLGQGRRAEAEAAAEQAERAWK